MSNTVQRSGGSSNKLIRNSRLRSVSTDSMSQENIEMRNTQNEQRQLLQNTRNVLMTKSLRSVNELQSQANSSQAKRSISSDNLLTTKKMRY
jgi:hypothetical protein